MTQTLSRAQRAVTRVILASSLCLVLSVLTGGSAAASCASSPEDSPSAFTGTVVAVQKDGRLATVVLDDGSQVEVQGSPELGDNVRTSVDRLYTLGARYEFHPYNQSNPFQDNACSATRQISGPPPAGYDVGSGDRLPSWSPIDQAQGPSGYAVLAVPALLLIAATFIATRRINQWRRRRSPQADELS